MSVIGNPIITTNYVSDSFSGDASTVAFTLSQAPASAASIAVYISGLYQIPGSAYTISGTTLTFTGAPPIGTSNITVLHLGVKNQNLVPSAGSITPAMLNNANVVYWSASNNNVGIGNVTPTSLLTVTGTAALGNTTFAGTISANGGVGTAGQVLTSGATGNAYWSTVSTTLDSVLGTGNTTTKALTTGALTVNGAFVTTTNTATFGTAVYYVANGNVGLGTSSPSYLLHVKPSSGSPIVVAEGVGTSQAGFFAAIGADSGSYPGYRTYQGVTHYWSIHQRGDTNLHLYRESGSGGVVIDSGTLDVASRGITKASMPSGTVLQVVSASKTDTQSFAPSTSWSDVTGLSVSITPTSSTSKILVYFSIHAGIGAGDSGHLHVRIDRSGTSIGIADAASNRSRGSAMAMNTSQSGQTLTSTNMYLDSPGTTSSTTYKLQCKANDVGATAYINRSNRDNDAIGYDGRGVSNITVMEIAQ